MQPDGAVQDIRGEQSPRQLPPEKSRYSIRVAYGASDHHEVPYHQRRGHPSPSVLVSGATSGITIDAPPTSPWS